MQDIGYSVVIENMPEEDASWQVRGGVNIDSLHCSEKLYILLALFLASKPISELAEEPIWGSMSQATQNHEKPLILHLLIECAVLIRILDEQFPKVHTNNKPLEGVVGRLNDPSDASDEPLTLREACNKIIHSQTLNFDLEDGLHGEVKYLNPVLHLAGKRGEIPWKARLEIKDWVRSGIELAAFL